MITTRLRFRPGTTLIELLIFMAVLAAVGMAIFPLLFSSSEDRLLQQTVAAVEQNGIQLLQSIGTRVEQAESILMPELSDSGSVLALRMGSGVLTPTVIGINSGTLILAERGNIQDLSSSQVAVSNFRVRNTSVSATRQSVEVSFAISRTIRLQSPHSYSQEFRAAFSLFPDDVPLQTGCVCAVPGCADSNTFVWQICEEGACLTTQASMTCP